MADSYLAGLLAKYKVGDVCVRAVASQIVYPCIAQWAGAYLVEATYSGSIAKGTANSCSTDMDIFISLSAQTPETLKEIFGKLYQAAQGWGWNPRQQNVSIGVTVDGLSVDLVPGRQQAGYKNWHSLYHRRGDIWRQTNVAMHIDTVRQSGRTGEIRLMKLWRHLAGLEFPSFYLELCVLEALRGHPQGQLAANLSLALEWLHANLETRRIMDPANTANCISDDLTLAEKGVIARAAGVARARRYYSDFVW
ncbi:nucleotidyltransferase [Burkholderia pseudomallei]|nr:nucleotidyltransferase [Burkholderia pseudomallei]